MERELSAANLDEEDVQSNPTTIPHKFYSFFNVSAFGN